MGIRISQHHIHINEDVPREEVMNDVDDGLQKIREEIFNELENVNKMTGIVLCADIFRKENCKK